MNLQNLLKKALLVGMIPIFVTIASTVHADLAESYAEKDKVNAQVLQLQGKVENQKTRVNILSGRSKAAGPGYLDPEVAAVAKKVLADYELQLKKASSRLKSIQAKITKQLGEEAKNAAKLAAQNSNQNTTRDASHRAAMTAAKNAVTASKESMKGSTKSSGQEAAKSAVSYPPPPH